MPATATLRLSRTIRVNNIPSRRWAVVVDEDVAGTLSRGETLDIAVAPGQHLIQVKSTNFLYSPVKSVDVLDGHVMAFSCRSRSLSPIMVTRWIVWFVASLFNHELWIALDFVDDGVERRSTNFPAASVASTHTAASAFTSSGVSRVRDVELASPLARRPREECALITERLTKRFGARTAFSELSLEIGYGEVFGFLGPNGAGKTTTVRTLGTLISPTSGTALVAGIPLTPENGVEIRQHISIMPEAPGLYLRLTVHENLEYFAALFGLHHAEARIKKALDAVNLGDRASDLCGSLSKGLRQRVGIARTLLSDPAIMFLDEPTSGLDPVASLEVHNLILDLRRQGVTIFLTTHRLDEAEKLCDRVAIMNTTLRSVGGTEELRERLFKRTLGVKTLAPLVNPASVFAHVTGVEEWSSDASGSYQLIVTDPNIAAPDVTRALVAAGADVLNIAEVRRSLEDVYLELIDDDVEASA